jgi:hypothetical protein
MELFQYHCIDTSALISMWREHYRPKNFPSVWRLMEEHIDRGELVAPREVYEELAQGNDDLFEFVKRKQNKLFKELDEEQSRFVFEIKAKFPKLSDYNKAVPDADPFVVALAMQKGWKVVTSESDKSPYKIPAACRFYRIPCLSPADFIQENRWEI